MRLSLKNLKVLVTWNYIFLAKLQKKRVFPAIDFNRSGTRKEDLLTTPDELQKMWILRKILNPMGEVEAMEFLIDKLMVAKTNDEFFEIMKRS